MYYTSICKYVNKDMYMYFIHVSIYLSTYLSIYLSIYIYVHVYVSYICTCISMCIYIYTHHIQNDIKVGGKLELEIEEQPSDL